MILLQHLCILNRLAHGLAGGYMETTRNNKKKHLFIGWRLILGLAVGILFMFILLAVILVFGIIGLILFLIGLVCLKFWSE